MAEQRTSTGIFFSSKDKRLESRRHPILLKNLSIGYTGKHSSVKTVASGISVKIYSGCLNCLIGSNGVGKSTLLRTLSGFQKKLGGEIFIDGKEIETYTNKELARKISVVLTDRASLQNMTVRELVGIGRSPYTNFWGTLSAEDEAIVTRSINLVGIQPLAERMIQTLSDGERQKVMIAKALAQETPIIFLDEPTAFLDYPSKIEMMQLLHRLSRETDKTIFLSTHDLELVLQLADIIWLMEREHGLSVGTPRELADNGAITRFIDRHGIHFNTQSLNIQVIGD